jgi:hypothetical protein
MTRPPAMLYHLAEASNLSSIQTHGLMSTARLLDLAAVPKSEHPALLRRHRPDGIHLSETIMIRDQRPMPPGALANALDDNLQPADWYMLLNSFVFLWPDRARMERQRNACADRPQALLRFHTEALLERFASDAFVSPINSGNARRKPARRGLWTFLSYQTWLRDGWPTGARSRPPAEIVFRTTIPVHGPHLVDFQEF